VAPLLAPCPYIDELIAFDDFRFKGTRWSRGEKAATIVWLAGRLRRRGYDSVVVLHRSFRAMRTLARLVGAEVTCGVTDGSDGYTHGVPLPAGIESSREENRRVLERFGIAEDGHPTELWTTDQDRRRAAVLLGDDHGPLVALHPGSDWSCQQWLPERFAEVGAALQRQLGARIVLTGSAAETGLQEEIAGLLPTPPVRLAGRTTFGELVEVIRRLDLIVCVNSAPAAIADALGIPSIVLMGPEDPRLTDARTGPGRLVVRSSPELPPGGWCEFGRWGVLSGCESPICRGLAGLGAVQSATVIAGAASLMSQQSALSGRPVAGAPALDEARSWSANAC
jgi:ADP-heptose:LPS heptosyltransferase